VKNALVAAFRICRDPEYQLFPTRPDSSKQVHHLLFMFQSFVSSFSGYVFDTAITASLMAFTTSLTKATTQFSDIYALSAAHSAAMDNALSACLLRSNQKEAAVVLHECLQLVLSFSVLISELRRGRIGEDEGATLLVSQYADLRMKRELFVCYSDHLHLICLLMDHSDDQGQSNDQVSVSTHR
jgi:hypothetical protein